MLKKFFSKKSENQNDEHHLKINSNEQVPSHIAIIMDGNGRWANNRSLPRIAGHHEGMKNVRKITRYADDIGVKVLSLYAFSTENWKRPKTEVDFLMGLPEQFLNTFLPELMERNIRVQTIGEIDVLPASTKRALDKAINQTKNNTGLILNFAMNYGGRAEIVKAMQKMATDVAEGKLTIDAIDESQVSQYLMTADLPEPDLLIRTSGELRLSNFMLWQLAYAEFWFTDVHWPDFNEETLTQAITDYQQRNRRYGGLKGEESI